MSADGSSEGPIDSASKKREAAYRALEEDSDLPEEQAVKLVRKHLPWKDWLLADFLRYWYVLGCLALDVFLPLRIARWLHADSAYSILGLVVLLLVLVYLETRTYIWIWPSGVKTRIETQRRAFRRAFRKLTAAFRRD
ncbi:MAG: hypothetical protein ABIE25_00425 [Thermoplasmatota archaeon]|nr:hypothetical protein [Candidatus Thermoplasmatota archaeon]